MVHVRPATLGIQWLRSGFAYSAPLVLVGGREDLLGLPLDVQARACEFLIDGWQPEEVILRLSFAMARSTPAAPAGTGSTPGAADAPRLGPAEKPRSSSPTTTCTCWP